jgi:hypothetical protein
VTRPLPFSWDGEVMRPTRGFARLADQAFVVGEVYTLEAVEGDRSMRSHRHYFKAVYEAWLNLGEADAERFPTETHLRKYALIKAGYCTIRELVCSSRAEAVRVGAFARGLNEYALTAINGNCVRVYIAQSQDTRSMGRKVFQESKDAVLGVLAGMIEVDKDQLLSFDGARDRGEPNKPSRRAA